LKKVSSKKFFSEVEGRLLPFFEKKGSEKNFGCREKRRKTGFSGLKKNKSQLENISGQ